jgi:Ca-activated chloride channel family protein
VFLLDVSGSMQPENKLPLVKAGMELLVEQLNENDRISIVTYAGNAGLVLEPTSGDDKETILSAIRNLHAGGSTNGEAGIKLAYTQAIRNFTEHGANRVILCTDGDFNVGVSSDDELVAMIQEKAKQSRVYLSIFGFGMGNLKDAKLEQLANKGNGHYGYIDDLREAKKVFSEELMGTLYTIAKDVKIQVEFNPQRVGAYRLIGYENRALANRDFTDDTKDAGEIGAGHTVTALYEVAPLGKVPADDAVELKYQRSAGRGRKSEARREAPEEFRNELLTVKLRYKLPDADSSVPLEFPLVDDPGRSLQASHDFNWAAAVAAFGMVLRDSQYKGQASLDLVRELAEGALGPEPSEGRREFLELARTAESLRTAGQNGAQGTKP